jgi:hypothetical protein
MNARSSLGSFALTTFLVGEAAAPTVAQDSSFFPEHPPAGVEMHETFGILLDYGIGMESGGFTISL